MSLSRQQPSEIAAQREAVVAEAMTWLRTPYHHMGRIKGVGVDCAQILILVYSAAGVIDNFETEFVPSDWMLHQGEERYLAWIEKFAHRVEVPQPGDVALYRYGRTVSHSAIVIKWPLVLHAHKPDHMVTLGEGDKGELADRLHGFYSMWSDDVRTI